MNNCWIACYPPLYLSKTGSGKKLSFSPFFSFSLSSTLTSRHKPALVRARFSEIMEIQLPLVHPEVNLITHSLPIEPGPLPLYLDDDGFYSVLGPPLSQTAHEDQVDESINDTLTCNPIDTSPTLTPPRGGVFCESPKCSGNRSAPSLHYMHRLTQRSGPHTCSRGCYICKASCCTWPTPFRTKQALNRHYEVIHLATRFNCPVPRCEKINRNGIKRYDNLVAHLRNKHGISPMGGSCRKQLVGLSSYRMTHSIPGPDGLPL